MEFNTITTEKDYSGYKGIVRFYSEFNQEVFFYPEFSDFVKQEIPDNFEIKTSEILKLKKDEASGLHFCWLSGMKTQAHFIQLKKGHDVFVFFRNIDDTKNKHDRWCGILQDFGCTILKYPGAAIYIPGNYAVGYYSPSEIGESEIIVKTDLDIAPKLQKTINLKKNLKCFLDVYTAMIHTCNLEQGAEFKKIPEKYKGAVWVIEQLSKFFKLKTEPIKWKFDFWNISEKDEKTPESFYNRLAWFSDINIGK